MCYSRISRLLILLSTVAWAQLPLGAPGLPETRTEDQLAPGLRYTRIVRGNVDRRQHYTVQVAVVGKDELVATLQRLRALGLEGWQRPAGDRVSVRMGHIELRPFADELERNLRALGFAEAKVLHTSDDPEADQGPWVVHVLEVEWEAFGGRAEVALALAPATLLRLTPANALAAVNGDYFVERLQDGRPGDPTGIAVVRGNVLSEHAPGRTALIVDAGASRIARLETRLEVVNRAGESRRIDGLNRALGRRRDVDGHDTTTVVADEIVLETSHQQAGWPGQLGVWSALTAIGSPQSWLAAQNLSELSLSLKVLEEGQQLHGNYSAVGGGPQLLKDGELAIRAREEGFERLLYTFGLRRNPRTLAGVTDDGRLLLVVVDGRQPEWSVGATFEESARLLQALGARDGLNLDGGGSSTMVIRGEVVNRPSEGKPRAIGDAIVILP